MAAILSRGRWVDWLHTLTLSSLTDISLIPRCRRALCYKCFYHIPVTPTSDHVIPTSDHLISTSDHGRDIHLGIILLMCPANERQRYSVMAVMPSLIGWGPTQNYPWRFCGQYQNCKLLCWCQHHLRNSTHLCCVNSGVCCLKTTYKHLFLKSTFRVWGQNMWKHYRRVYMPF